MAGVILFIIFFPSSILAIGRKYGIDYQCKEDALGDIEPAIVMGTRREVSIALPFKTEEMAMNGISGGFQVVDD